MAINIATLAIKFVADTTGIKSGVGGVVSSILTGAAAFIGINRAMATFTASAERIDKMSKVADRLGTSFETIQGMNLGAGLAGLGLDEVTDAIDKMSKKIGSGGMSLDKRFLQQAEAIAAIVDPAEQARAAMDLFGKSGAKLLPVLKQGGKAFKESAELITKFKLGISDIDAKNVERMNDSWTKLGAIISGTVDKIVAEMAPSMGAFLDRTIEQLGSMDRLWEGFGILTEDILTDFADFGELVDSIGFNLQQTGHALKAIGHWGDQTPMEIMGWMPPSDATRKMEREWELERKAGENSNKSWDNFWKGTAGKELSAEAAKRRAEDRKKSGMFDGTETRLRGVGAAKDSQEAAKIINAGTTNLTAAEKAAIESAKTERETKRVLEQIRDWWINRPPVSLATGGI